MKHALPSCSSRRGVTLLLTMLVLVLAVTILGRQMLRTTVERVSSASASFSTESQWIAEGVADQWQEHSRDPNANADDLLRPASWQIPASRSEVTVQIDIHPSSSQNKLYLPAMEESDWTAFCQEQFPSIHLASNPARKLLESGNTALEVILDPSHISAQDAYLPLPGTVGREPAPSDLLTVWGDGCIDLNRCSREVLQARLKGFTDAQINGILRIRASGPVKDLVQIHDELSLSEDQSRLLGSVAAYAPSTIELLIRIRKGGLNAVYFAVLKVGRDGQVLEVRPIL